MATKNIAITGGNDGIGYATSEALLKQGHRLTLFCRNKQKAELARQKLIDSTGNQQVDIILADMASFTSIQKACNTFLEKNDSLDILINNAGGMFTKYEQSEDGIEMCMAVNHFGYYLTTYHLMPALINAPNARIVNIASRAHEGVTLDFENINKKSHFNFRKQYKYSKLANVLFTRQLSELLKTKGITVNCLDPGVVKTKIGNKTDSKLMGLAWKIFTLRGISPDTAAKTPVYLATSEEVKDISGEYFEECKIHESSPASKDMGLAKDLWDWTEHLSGCKWNDLDFMLK